MATRKITGLMIKLGLDASGVEGGFKSIDKAISQSMRELKNIDKALKLDPTNTVLLAQKQEVLAQALEKSRERLKGLEDAQEKMAKAAANNPDYEAAYEPLKKQLDETEKKMKKLQSQKEEMDQKLSHGEIDVTEWGKYKNELIAAEQKMKSLEEEKEALDKRFSEGHITAEEYRNYQRELEQVRAETARLEKQTKELDGVTDQSSKAFRKAVESTKEYQQAMDKLNASAGELKSKVGGALNEIWNIALKVGTAITSAAVAAGAASVKIGSDFDASMSNVEALSRATGNELDTLREKAKEMGATTSKTAKESADALGYMALAGWDTQQMLEGLEPILRASEAGNMELATTSDLVTDSMSAMGVSVNDLTHYLDVATKAQSSSNTSLEELLNAYVVAGGTFKNFNVGLEESATLLGTLANRGIKGSEAGNALNSVLINLIGASGKSSEAMKTLGVSAFDTNGEFIGVTETLEQVAAALEKLDDEQRAVLTAQLGGKTQYDTLQALLSGVNEEYDELYGKILDSNGALEEMSKIMRDNLKGDVNALKSALDVLGIEVNDQLNEAFRGAVQAATKEVSKLSTAVSDGELGESLQKIAEAFAKLIEQIVNFAANKGIPTTIKFFEFIADNGEFVKSLIIGIASAFVTWKFVSTIIGIYQAFMKFKAAATESAIAMTAFNNVCKANIILAVASAVLVLVNAFVGLAKNVDNVQKRIKKLNEEIAEIKNNTDENIASSNAEIAVIEKKAEKYEELRQKEDRTAGEEERLKELAEELQQYMPNGTQLIDEQTGAYNSLAGSIDSVTAAMRRKATIAAYEEEYTELVKKQLQAEKELETALRIQKQGENMEARGQGTWGTIYQKSKRNEAVAEAQATLNSVNKDLDYIDKQIEKLHEDAAKNQIVEAPASSAQIVAEGMAKKYAEEAKTAAEAAEQEYTNVLNTFKKEMDDLDFQKNIHQIDDSTYWNERRRILNENLLKETEEWWKYYDETEEYFEKLTDEQKKAYEEQIKNQAEALQEKLELNDDYTDEMYYNELETVISALSQESDLYKKYYSEILKGRKNLSEALENEALEAKKTQIEAAQQAISEIQSEYSNMLSEVTAEQESYKNKLLNMAQLYTSETERDSNGNEWENFTLENIDAQIKAIEDYDDKIKKLEARGIGENLSSYIESLSQEDSEKVMQVLNSMTDEQLKAYSDKYDKLLETVNERAESRYEPQIEEINKSFSEKILESMGTLPDDMAIIGQEAINGFIAGFSESPEKLIEAVSEECNAVIEGFKSALDIHSPSKKTEKIGEYAAEGFEKGLEEISGADAAEQFADDFIMKMAEKDSQLHDVLYNAFAGNTAEAIAQMNSEASKAMNNIVPSLQLPDITKFTLPKSAELSLSAQRADERVVSLLQDISEYLQNIITLFSALLSQNRTEQIDLTSTINTYLDGALLAKTVTKQQTIQRKGNGS